MRTLATLLLCLLAYGAFSQETSRFAKFGKITADDLRKKVYSIDSGANAVVLSDIGAAAIEGNSKNWFSIVFTRHRVVHILNKNGYNKADVEIILYFDGNAEERLESIKAVTYNLEGDKVIETKLEKENIFKEKIDKNRLVKKFTMPAVKEGSIIEFEYKVTSDFITNLDAWAFQGSAPVLWSEYTLSVPEFFSYAFLAHGYHPVHIADKKNTMNSFTVIDANSTGASDRTRFTAGVTDYRWVMKDVPEIKPESFSSALKNHISALEFQLSSMNPPLRSQSFRNSWPGLISSLIESEYFGKNLNSVNTWMSDEIKPLTAKASSDLEKAKNIYEYVRSNFACSDYSGLWTSQLLRNVMKTKKGNVADINLLLTAMLRHAGLKAYPVILSTTGHGYVSELYPMISSFNYVITQLKEGGKTYYLDASRNRLGFGKLMPTCFNGHARVVDDSASRIVLTADSLKERKVTSLFLTNSEKNKWVGSMNQTAGYYESYSIREKIAESGTDAFFKQVQKDFGADVRIENPRIDSISRLEMPVALKYGVELDYAGEDILYVNPMFGEGYKKNPFTSAQRYYPVEMPYTIDETFLLTLEVPDGYEVDELPKQLVAKLDDQESASFEFRLSQSGRTISMRSRIKISRTLFLPEEYETLREFFNLIVSKHNEQIVFKKK